MTGDAYDGRNINQYKQLGVFLLMGVHCRAIAEVIDLHSLHKWRIVDYLPSCSLWKAMLKQEQ